MKKIDSVFLWCFQGFSTICENILGFNNFTVSKFFFLAVLVLCSFLTWIAIEGYVWSVWLFGGITLLMIFPGFFLYLFIKNAEKKFYAQPEKGNTYEKSLYLLRLLLFILMVYRIILDSIEPFTYTSKTALSLGSENVSIIKFLFYFCFWSAFYFQACTPSRSILKKKNISA